MILRFMTYLSRTWEVWHFLNHILQTPLHFYSMTKYTRICEENSVQLNRYHHSALHQSSTISFSWKRRSWYFKRQDLSRPLVFGRSPKQPAHFALEHPSMFFWPNIMIPHIQHVLLPGLCGSDEWILKKQILQIWHSNCSKYASTYIFYTTVNIQIKFPKNMSF